MCLVVVDLVGTPTNPLEVSLGPWSRVVQRLARAPRGFSDRVRCSSRIEGAASSAAPRRLANRVPSVPAPDQLAYRVTKSSQGTFGSDRALAPASREPFARHASQPCRLRRIMIVRAMLNRRLLS